MLDFIKSIPARLRHNFWLKLLSILIAFVVWVVVVAYYNPETTNLIEDIPITVDYEKSVLEEQGLILVTIPEGTVDVKIEGRREKLALINKEKVTAMISLSSVTKPGEYQLPINIVVDGQAVTTVSQSVERMTLRVEKAVKAQFMVSVVAKGEIAEGKVLEKVANPTVVTVTGPESVVSKIVTVQAVVSQEKFTESGVYDASVIYLDKNGEKLDDEFLSIDTDAIKVNVSIYEEKTVPLQVELTNSSGGNDSAYLKVSIEPETIVIAGNADTLEGINSISLGSIDASDVEDGDELSIPLIVPNGIKNLGGIEKAKVTVSTEGTVTKQFKLSCRSIVIENADNKSKIDLPDSEIIITVRGDATDMSKLRETDISLRIDCKNQALAKGSNRMAVYCVFPEGYKVGAVGKYEATIKVS